MSHTPLHSETEEIKQPTSNAPFGEYDELYDRFKPRHQTPLQQEPEEEDNFIENMGEGFEIGSKQLISGAGKAISEVGKKIDPFDDWTYNLEERSNKYRATAPEGDDSYGQFFGQLIPSVVPSVAALGASLVPGGQGVGFALGNVAIAGMGLGSAGNGMYEYEEYQKRNGLEVDPNTMLAVGAAYGTAEVVAERVGLGYLMDGGGKYFLKGGVDKAIKTGTSLLSDFAKAKPSVAKKLFSESLKAGNIEGLEEVITSFAQDITANVGFKMDEDDAGIEEMLKNAGASYIAGSLMGATIGPLSYGAQNVQNKRRRKEQGRVLLAEDTKNGGIVEIISKSDNGYSVLTPSGAVKEVGVDDIGEQESIGTEQFYNVLNDRAEAGKHEELSQAQAEQEEFIQRQEEYNRLQSFAKPNHEGIPVLKEATYKSPGGTEVEVIVTGVDPQNPSLVYIQDAVGGSKAYPVNLSELTNITETPMPQLQQEVVGNRQPRQATGTPIQIGEKVNIDGVEVTVTGLGEGLVQLSQQDDTGEGEEFLEPMPLEVFEQFRQPQVAPDPREESVDNQDKNFDEEGNVTSVGKPEQEEAYEKREVVLGKGKKQKAHSIKVFSDNRMEVDKSGLTQKEAEMMANELNEKFPRGNFQVEDRTQEDDLLAETDFRVVGGTVQEQEQAPLTIEKEGKILYNKEGEQGLSPKQIFDRDSQFKEENEVKSIKEMGEGDQFYDVKSGTEFELVSKDGNRAKITTIGEGMNRTEDVSIDNRSYLPLNQKKDDSQENTTTKKGVEGKESISEVDKEHSNEVSPRGGDNIPNTLDANSNGEQPGTSKKEGVRVDEKEESEDRPTSSLDKDRKDSGTDKEQTKSGSNKDVSVENPKTSREEGLSEQEAFEAAPEEIQRIAYEYNELEDDGHLSLSERKIMSAGIKVTKEDFDRFGDRNLRKGNKGNRTKQFLRKDAPPLDARAEELGVTEQEIIDYIVNPPARVSPKKVELNDSYKRFTGYNINPEVYLSPSEATQVDAIQTILEAEQERLNKPLEELIQDPEFLALFEGFPYTPEELESVKQYLDEKGKKESNPNPTGDQKSDSKQTKREQEEEVDTLKTKEEELKAKLNNLFDDLGKSSGTLNTGIDPEKIVIAGKIISIGSELGLVKFNQFVNYMVENLGIDKAKAYFSVFQKSYGFHRMGDNPNDEDLNQISKSKFEDFQEKKASKRKNTKVSKEEAAELTNKYRGYSLLDEGGKELVVDFFTFNDQINIKHIEGYDVHGQEGANRRGIYYVKKANLQEFLGKLTKDVKTENVKEKEEAHELTVDEKKVVNLLHGGLLVTKNAVGTLTSPTWRINRVEKTRDSYILSGKVYLKGLLTPGAKYEEEFSLSLINRDIQALFDGTNSEYTFTAKSKEARLAHGIDTQPYPEFVDVTIDDLKTKGEPQELRTLKMEDLTPEEVQGTIITGLKKGDTFEINSKKYTVATVGQKQIKITDENKLPYIWKRMGKKTVYADSRSRANNLARDMEGILLTDQLNQDNIFHQKSIFWGIVQKALEKANKTNTNPVGKPNIEAIESKKEEVTPETTEHKKEVITVGDVEYSVRYVNDSSIIQFIKKGDQNASVTIQKSWIKERTLEEVLKDELIKQNPSIEEAKSDNNLNKDGEEWEIHELSDPLDYTQKNMADELAVLSKNLSSRSWNAEETVEAEKLYNEFENLKREYFKTFRERPGMQRNHYNNTVEAYKDRKGNLPKYATGSGSNNGKNPWADRYAQIWGYPNTDLTRGVDGLYQSRDEIEFSPHKKGWAILNKIYVEQHPNGVWSAGVSQSIGNGLGGGGRGASIYDKPHATKEEASLDGLNEFIQGAKKALEHKEATANDKKYAEILIKEAENKQKEVKATLRLKAENKESKSKVINGVRFDADEVKAIKSLDNATQSLIWFNTLATPIYSILDGNQDRVDKWARKAEKAGIIEDLTGFMSSGDLILRSASIVNFQKKAPGLFDKQNNIINSPSLNKTEAKSKDNESSTTNNLESNSPRKRASDFLGKKDVPTKRGASQQGTGQTSLFDAVETPKQSDKVLPRTDAIDRTPSDSKLSGESPRPSGSANTDRNGGASITDSQAVEPSNDSEGSNTPSGTVSHDDLDFDVKTMLQEEAEKVDVILNDEANIAETLPFLMVAQQGDVVKAERRFFEEGKKGILFTNGTGTGKTYTGLGVIKRFAKQGKTNILLLAPSQAKISDWIEDAENLKLEITTLDGIKDAGKGMVATTYENFGLNENLVNREWDLIVYDESHKISQAKAGASNDKIRVRRHKQLTNTPRVAEQKARDEFQPSKDKLFNKAAKEVTKEGEEDYTYNSRVEATETYQKGIKVINEKIAAETERLVNATKAVFLSATPFAYHKSLLYADGFLFDIYETKERDTSGGAYNSGDAWGRFMQTNLGYRMRYNKVTTPESGVDQGMMERALTDRLIDEGAISARKLDVPFDYSRQFIKVGNDLGEKFDTAMRTIWDDKELRKTSFDKVLRRKVNYLFTVQFLESIKAKEAIPRVQEHLKMGRKVVIFHNYVTNNPTHPFQFTPGVDIRDKGELAAVQMFEAKYPQYSKMDLTGLKNPIDTLKDAFGDNLTLFNGRAEYKKTRRAGIKEFNKDNSKVNVVLIQTQSGKEGLSLHDVTSKTQRVLINLGLPTRPTDLVQTEGRIYRLGVKSNAIYEHLTLQTSFEKTAFAFKVAEGSGTVENLALGSDARDMRTAIKEGYDSYDEVMPNDQQGIGTKEADSKFDEMSEFDRAKSFYYGTKKHASGKKSTRGADYFATPEPVGMKMVEWLSPQPNDHLLEPSAGHGAIARFFPKFTNNTAIEPSYDLSADLAMNSLGTTIKAENFEDHNIINKYDGIAMNPPFGSQSKQAVDHLIKATGHLNNGGRVIAILPNGGSMQKKFNKWYESKDAENFVLRSEIILPDSTFGRAGTGVNTKIMVIDKVLNEDLRVQLGPNSTLDLSRHKTVEELFDAIEHISIEDKADVNSMPVYSSKKKFETTTTKQAPVTKNDVIEFIKENKTKVEADFGLRVVQGKHTKTGADLFTVTMEVRMERNEFTALRGLSKEFDGYYSRFKGAGATPGFIFKTPEQANNFITKANEGLANLGSEATRFKRKGDTTPDKKDIPILEKTDKTNTASQVLSPFTVKHKKRVETLVKTATKGWKNAPKTEVWESALDFAMANPNDFIEEIKEVAGMRHKGKIHLFSNHSLLKTSSGVMETILHESIGHHGLRGFVSQVAKLKGTDLDTELNKLFDGIIESHQDSAEFLDLAKAYYPKAASLSQAQKRVIAEEIIAHRAENQETDSMLNDFISWVRRVIHKATGRYSRMSDQAIKDIISNSRKYLKVGDSFIDRSILNPFIESPTMAKRVKNDAQTNLFNTSSTDSAAETKREVLNGQLKTAKTRMKQLQDLQSKYKSASRIFEIKAVEKEVIRLTDAIQGTLNKDDATAGGEQTTMFKRVWHGSSKEFDKFSTAKSGSNEGNKFGYGVYLTDKKGVAKMYATGRNHSPIDGNATNPPGITKDQLNDLFKYYGTKGGLIHSLKGAKSVIGKPSLKTHKGRVKIPNKQALAEYVDQNLNENRFLYGVEINDDLNLLNWNKQITAKNLGLINTALQNYEQLPLYGDDEMFTGERIYSDLVQITGSPQGASELLVEAGISGNEYKGGTDATTNYVIFNQEESAIEEVTRFKRVANEEKNWYNNAKKLLDNERQVSEPSGQAELFGKPVEFQSTIGFKSNINEARPSSLRKKANTPEILTSGRPVLKNKGYSALSKKFTKNPYFSFTTKGNKVESAEDVAFIFRSLEEESVEHSFAVHHLEDGTVHVQHISIGAASAVMAPVNEILGVAKTLKAKQVTFVHNHPSGKLKPSAADNQVHRKLSRLLERHNIEINDSIIINLNSGDYLTFSNRLLSGKMGNSGQSNSEQPIDVYSFSKRVFYEGFEKGKTITGSSVVAQYLSQFRHGVGDKMAVLLLARSNDIIGNYPLTTNNEDEAFAQAEVIGSQMGASGMILYGNKKSGDIEPLINKFTNSTDISLVDYIQVSTDSKTSNEVKAYYSASDGDQGVEEPRFKRSKPDDFYSNSLNSLATIPMNKATGDQWRSMLLKNGANQHELEWIEFDDFLKRNPKPTKDQVLDFISSNKVEIVDVVKGGHSERVKLNFPETSKIIEEEQEEIDGLEVLGIYEDDEVGYSVIEFHDYYRVFDINGDEVYLENDSNLEIIQFEDAVQAAEEHLNEQNDSVLADETKYSDYTLPGGKDYKELLLTMPNNDLMNHKRSLEEKYGENYKGSQLEDSEIDKLQELKSQQIKNNYYKKEHWSEPNILAHIRFNSRIVNGEDVLFIEEIQSDWAQEGRKKGYISSDGKDLIAFREEMKAKYGTTWYNDRNNEEVAKDNALIKAQAGVPQMPFKQTAQWTSLALKRMIRYASENGFDRIAWVNGEQSAERYDLSKQVDNIIVNRNHDGYTLSTGDYPNIKTLAINISEGKIEDYVGKELAKKIIEDHKSTNPEKLTEILSKDAKYLKLKEKVDKAFEANANDLLDIMSQKDKYVEENYGELQFQETTYEEQDLKVGGEGMKSYYDKIVPSAASKLLKKFDKTAKVDNINLTSNIGGKGDPRPEDITPFEKTGYSMEEDKYDLDLWHISDPNGSVQGVIQGRKEAEMYAVAMSNHVSVEYLKQIEGFKGSNGNQQSFPITPALRQKSQAEGMPMFKRVPVVQEGKSKWQDFKETKYRQFIDMYADLERLQNQKLEKGGLLEDHMNAHTKETLSKSRITNQQEEFNKNHVKPLVDTVLGIGKKHNLKYDKVSQYLKAKHAIERNAYMREEQGAKDDAIFGGMADDEAQLIIDHFEAKVPKKTLDELHDQVRRINNYTLDKQYKDGMLTEEAYNKVKSMYKFYVPLRGYAAVSYDPTVFSGMKKATGRKSEAGDPIAYMMAMADTAIIHGEKNRVKRAMFEFVKANPDNKLYNVKNVWFVNTEQLDAEGKEIWVEQVDKPSPEQFENGLVKKSYNPDKASLRESAFTKENLTLLVKGKKVTIEFIGEAARIGEAFSQMHVDKAPKWLGGLGRYMRLLRSTYTMYSPEFVIRNLIRDMSAGFLNIQTDHGMGVATKTIGGVAKAVKTLNKGFKKGYDKSLLFKEDKLLSKEEIEQKRFLEFVDAGAQTGYSDIKSVSEHQEKLKGQIDGLKGNTIAWSKEQFGKLLKPIDDTNRVFENSMRFSAFKQMRNKGLSIDKAALYAKELTVNFNRKGEWSDSIGAMYLFFNASIQGGNRVLQPFSSTNKKVRNRAIATALTLPAMTMMLSMMGRLIGGKDEDDEYYYDKLPEHTRTHNLIIPNIISDKEGDFIQIPLPYGFNFYNSVGDHIMRALLGKESLTQSAIAVASSALGSFSPLGSPDLTDEDSEWHEKIARFAPTVGQPFVDLAYNRNFAGYPIYREPFSKGQTARPDAQNYYSNVNPIFRGITDTLTDWTGGDEHTPGAIDVNPETIEHFASTLGGGVLSFGNNMAHTLAMGMSGNNPVTFDDGHIKKVPFIRNYFTAPSTGYNQQMFFDNYHNIMDDKTIYKRYLKDHDKERALEYKNENPNSFKLMKMAEVFKKRANIIRDKIKTLESLPESPSRASRIKELESRENKLYMDFNQKYDNFNVVKDGKVSDYIAN